jgi:hypothetical protein
MFVFCVHFRTKFAGKKQKMLRNPRQILATLKVRTPFQHSIELICSLRRNDKAFVGKPVVLKALLARLLTIFLRLLRHFFQKLA